MIAEISLALTALLLYKKTEMKSFLGIGVSVMLAIFTKLAIFPLALSLLSMVHETVNSKPLNNSRR